MSIDLSRLRQIKQQTHKGFIPPIKHSGYAATQYQLDRELGYDSIARMALETLRDSYNPQPTSNHREFARFFSQRNYNHLKEQIERKAGGNKVDENDLFDYMIRAFTMIRPRSDNMDIERRNNFDDSTVNSYVSEMNSYIMSNLPFEIIQANKLWDAYAENMNGPPELIDHPGIDTRSRNRVSYYPFDYWMD
jgi:hypothetical protein